MTLALYYLGLSALCAHEMDAVMQTEWRLLYLLRTLPDEQAYPLFVALHVPLFYLFFWLSHHSNALIRGRFRLAVAAFLVIHAGLHLRLSGDEAYRFDGPFSNGLIWLSALCGFGYLVMTLLKYRENRP